MKKIILILLAFNLSGAPYESAQRFSEGDTISAEVLNDILDRIELTLKPIDVSELPGTWEVNQYWCGQSLANPDVDATNEDRESRAMGCNRLFLLKWRYNMDGLALKGLIQFYTAVSGSETLWILHFNNKYVLSRWSRCYFCSLNEPKLIDAHLLEIALFGCVG